MLVRKSGESIACYDEREGGYTLHVFKANKWTIVLESKAAMVMWNTSEIGSFSLFPPAGAYSGRVYAQNPGATRLTLGFDVADTSIILRTEILSPDEFMTFKKGGGLKRRKTQGTLGA